MKTLDTILRKNPALPLKAVSRRYAVSMMAVCGYHEALLEIEPDMLRWHKARLDESSLTWDVSKVPRDTMLTRFGTGRKQAADHGGMVTTIGNRLSDNAIAAESAAPAQIWDKSKLAEKVFAKTVAAITAWKELFLNEFRAEKVFQTQELLDEALLFSLGALHPDWELQINIQPRLVDEEENLGSNCVIYLADGTLAQCNRWWGEILFECMTHFGYKTKMDWTNAKLKDPDGSCDSVQLMQKRIEVPVYFEPDDEYKILTACFTRSEHCPDRWELRVLHMKVEDEPTNEDFSLQP